MLQDLELADRHAELFARLQVIEGQLAGLVHAAQRVGALRGDGAALLVAQRRERITDFAEQRVGAHLHVVEEQLAALASVDGRVDPATDALSVRIDEEQADASIVAAVAGSARRDDDPAGAVPADYHGLASGQAITAVGRFGFGLYIVKIVVALRLVECHRQLQRTGRDLRQQIFFLRVAAQLVEQAAAEDHRLQVGFKRQAAAQLGHHQHGFHTTAAKAADLLGKRHGSQA